MGSASTGPPGIRYRAEDVEIVPSRHCILRNGAITYLRPKTFEVLMYLLENRHRPVGKQELLEHFWAGLDITENSVPQCINELRRALADDPRSPRLIRTLPKVGYQFIAAVEEQADTPPDAVPPRSRWRRPVFAASCIVLTAAILWTVLRRPSDEPARTEAAWWTLDGSISSARIEGPASWVPGRIGRAIRFLDSSAHVKGSSASNLPLGNSPRTITAWVNARPNGDSSAVLHYGAKGPGRRSFALWLRENGVAAAGALWHGGEVSGRTVIADGEWHLLSAVYEGPESNLLRLYVDGTEESSTKLDQPPDTAGDEWTMGKFLDHGSSLRGSIDDVRVYAVALNLSEVGALYRCYCASADPYFMPIWPGRLPPEPIGAHGFLARGAGYSGMQFASAAQGCSLRSLRGMPLSQNVRIEGSFRLSPVSGQSITEAGPYFRSRRAHAGDGIIGPVSAGYWVTLRSTGEIKVRTLNPFAVVAFTGPIDDFDSTEPHHLAIEARASRLSVWLDNHPVHFDQNGRDTTSVELKPVWEGPPKVGNNDGAAGITFWREGAFSPSDRVENIAFSPLR